MEKDIPNLSSPQSIPPVSSPRKFVYILWAILVIAGAVTGYFLAASPKSGSPKQAASAETSGGQVKNSKEVGSTNSVFKDTAVGVLQKGGLGSEGTHKLIRPGGDSQTVYLVSSVIDLDEMEGKKIEVFGQTLRAQKVGWLMDVGRVKIVE